MMGVYLEDKISKSKLSLSLIGLNLQSEAIINKKMYGKNFIIAAAIAFS